MFEEINPTSQLVIEQVKSMGSLGGFEKIKSMIPGLGKARIPENLLEEAKKYRAELIEKIVEQDDALMTEYLEGIVPNVDTLKKVLRKAVIANNLFPVFAGSALKNKGVQLVLDAVIDYLPAPDEVVAIKGLMENGEENITKFE